MHVKYNNRHLRRFWSEGVSVLHLCFITSVVSFLNTAGVLTAGWALITRLSIYNGVRKVRTKGISRVIKGSSWTAALLHSQEKQVPSVTCCCFTLDLR